MLQTTLGLPFDFILHSLAQILYEPVKAKTNLRVNNAIVWYEQN